MRRLMIAAAAATVLALSPTVFAQQGQLGTPQEARVMLDTAVAAVKADQAVALAMFNKGEGGLKDAISIRSALERRTGNWSPVHLRFPPGPT